QLGGDVSPAQAILIEEIAKKALIVRATGDYILRQETLVKGDRLLEVVMQHDRLVVTLAGVPGKLGPPRRGEDGATLDAYLAARARSAKPSSGGEAPQSP